MPDDFYELLEIPDNANEVWIRRAYALKSAALAQDTTLDEGRRNAKIAAVEDAFAILSTPSTRHIYDRDRLKLPEPELVIARQTGITAARLTIWGVVALLVVGATWAYWRYAKEHERQRVEQERIALEVAALVREGEARDLAQRVSMEKIGRGIEHQLVVQQNADRARWQAEAAALEKADDGDMVKNEMNSLQRERTRVEQATRAEAARRLR